MTRSFKLLILLILISLAVTAQKPPLNHSVYDSWETINQRIISRDGKWVAYTVDPQEGDNRLILFNSENKRKDTVARGSNPLFSPESKFVAYNVVPSLSEIRQAKKKKLKEDQMPKNSLEIRNLENDSVIKADRVKSFQIPERNSFWMAYLHEKKKKEPESAVPDSLKSKKINPEEKKNQQKPDSDGADFVIINPVLFKEYRFSDVVEFSVSRDGKTISFMQSFPDTGKIVSFKVSVFDTAKETVTELFEGKGGAKKLSSDKSGNLISFIYSPDTARIKVYDLWLSKDKAKAEKIVDSSNPAMRPGWSVSENADFTFSDSGKRLYFGTAPKPVKEKADTLLEDEKYKLDIWSWTDDILQPMQKKQLDQEKKRSYLAVYFTEKGFMTQLADSAMPSVKINYRTDKNLALGNSDLKYRKLSSWDSRNFNDYYIVDLQKGTRNLILEKQPGQVELSPSRKYLLYWNSGERLWEIKNIAGGETRT
ncbi:MAG: hypothetical protein HPY62_05210, partial [Bacteroidales bacterium]|nr:hypothetical protein [Bacteroidales bacterium]